MTAKTGGQRGDLGARPGEPAWTRAPLAYAAVQGVLVVAVIAGPQPVAGIAAVLTLVVGAGALTVRVARRRRRSPGWWLVVASAWTLVLVCVLVVAGYGLRSNVTIKAPLPILASALAFALLAAGLALLTRADPSSRPADQLDTVMTALAAFLLLWAVTIDPSEAVKASSILLLAGFTFGCLLVGALGVQLLVRGGLRYPATALLFIAVLALVGMTVMTVTPVLGRPEMQSRPAASVFFLTYAVAIGAAGLKLAPTSRVLRPREPAAAGTGRIVLFAVLALVPPAAWALEIAKDEPVQAQHALAAWVPMIGSGAFLVLLVVRLGLIARLADRRTAEVAQRSAALAAAMSEQAELQRQLTFRAWHDPLTGLLNRDVVTERLAAALGRRDPVGRHALLLLDLDGFKDVNDTLGHPVGDELLVEVSRRLVRAVPAGATLARLGGDEFAVLIAGIEPAAAIRRAEALLAAFRLPYPVAGKDIFLTTSIGVLVTGPDNEGRTPSDALRDVDLALYAAKEAGRNRVELFRPELRDARQDHAEITAGLRQALANDEFVLHYQPVVDLETGVIFAVEALIRWERPNPAPGDSDLEPTDGLEVSSAEGPVKRSTTMVGPDAFVPIAEDTGLIDGIGTWALQQACRDGRRWYDEHRVAVTVNVSGRQFEDPGFADLVLRVLRETGMSRRGLILEITESSLVETSMAEDVHRQLRRLRSHGIRIAIDDFGTGYSSLSYVAKLPVDIVKIDKSFTQEPGGPDAGWAFTNAILRLVETLDLLAIVEGVETAEQADALRALRCPLVQGFYFAGPAPAPDIDRALSAGRALATR